MRKLLVFIFAFINLNSYAYRYAISKSRQTIVYADVELTAPIGFIRSGRKLKVGDNSLKKGTIVPLVVSGKIAYIKADDITFTLSGSKLEHTPEVTNHDVETIFKNDAQKLRENSYFSMDYSIFSAGSEWQDFNIAQANEDAPSLNRVDLSIEHRDPKGRHGFKFSLGYLFGSSSFSSIRSIYGELQYQYRLINRTSFSLEAYGGLILTGDFEQSNYSEKSAGAAWGYDIGGRLRIAPFSRIGFYGQAGLIGMSSSAMDELSTDVVDSIGGVLIGAGVSFRL